MGRIILGLVVTAVGVLVVIKTEGILNTFGRIDFFDRHLGTEGGSRLGYKFIGMIFIFLGILMITNMIGDFMNWMLSPLVRGGRISQ